MPNSPIKIFAADFASLNEANTRTIDKNLLDFISAYSMLAFYLLHKMREPDNFPNLHLFNSPRDAQTRDAEREIHVAQERGFRPEDAGEDIV